MAVPPRPGLIAALSAPLPFFFLLSLAGNAFAEGKTLGLQGDLAFDSRYSYQNTASWGWQPPPWDYGSNSRLSLTYGDTRLTLSVSRPMGYRGVGDPSRFYTLELTSGRYALRYGDLTPNFTAATTGFARLNGVESRMTLGRGLVEINSIHGSSQRASGGTAYTSGSYRRRVTGHHLRLTPMRAWALGFSVLRLKDSPAAMPFSGPSLQRLTAKDDLLIGTDATLYFMRRRASLTLEYVASIYNADLSAPAGDGLIESDGALLGGLSRNPLVRQFVTPNDSTRAGQMFFARLMVPVARTRSTLEYHRTSPSFTSLALPYTLSDSERFRLMNSVQIIPSSMTMTFAGDYSHSNLSGRQPFATQNLNLSLSMAMTSATKGRLTTMLRQNTYQSDGPVGSLGILDPHVDRSTRSLTLTGARDLRAKGVPFTASGSIMASRTENRSRAASGLTMYSVQIGTESLPTSRLIVGSQTNYTRMFLDMGGLRRYDARLLLKGGYQIKPDALHLYGTGGLSRAASSNGFERTQGLLWGGGAKWVLKTGRELELQWQSTETSDPFSNRRRREVSLGVRFNYSFASTHSG